MSNLTDVLFEAYREDLITVDFMMESIKILDPLKKRYKVYQGYDTKGAVAMCSEVWVLLKNFSIPNDWKQIRVYIHRLNTEKPILKIQMKENDNKDYYFDPEEAPNTSMKIIGAVCRHRSSISLFKKYDDASIRYENDGSGWPIAFCQFGKACILGGYSLNESTDDEYTESFHPIKAIKMHDIIKKERENEKVKGSGEFGQKLYNSFSKYITYGDLSEIVVSSNFNNHSLETCITMTTSSGKSIDGMAYLGMNASKHGKEDAYYVINQINPIIRDFLRNHTFEGEKLKGITIRFYNDDIGLAYSIKYET